MWLYERIAHKLPKGFRENLQRTLRYAGFDEHRINKFIGFMVLFSMGVGIVGGILLYLFGFEIWAAAGGVIAGAVALIVTQTGASLIGDTRARNIEVVLPDCLQLIAANIRAGVTVDQAIWLSARPEFGILEDEIRKVGAKTIGGKTVKDALIEMTEHIASDILHRAIMLLNEGMEAGGELAKLLEETASNIRTQQMLRKEIRAAVTMYTMLILFAAVLGAPVLFAVSIQFVIAIGELWGPANFGNTQAMGGFGIFKMASGPSISPDVLLYFALSAVTITTLFGGMIISMVQYGQARRGIKYAPILMLAALAVFFTARSVVSGMLSFV